MIANIVGLAAAVLIVVGFQPWVVIRGCRPRVWWPLVIVGVVALVVANYLRDPY